MKVAPPKPTRRGEFRAALLNLPSPDRAALYLNLTHRVHRLIAPRRGLFPRCLPALILGLAALTYAALPPNPLAWAVSLGAAAALVYILSVLHGLLAVRQPARSTQ